MVFRFALIALRRDRRLSVTQFAAACGLGHFEVSKLESGKNQASTARIRAGLARGFGVPSAAIDALVEGMDVGAAGKAFDVAPRALRSLYAGAARDAARPPEAA